MSALLLDLGMKYVPPQYTTFRDCGSVKTGASACSVSAIVADVGCVVLCLFGVAGGAVMSMVGSRSFMFLAGFPALTWC